MYILCRKGTTEAKMSQLWQKKTTTFFARYQCLEDQMPLYTPKCETWWREQCSLKAVPLPQLEKGRSRHLSKSNRDWMEKNHVHILESHVRVQISTQLRCCDMNWTIRKCWWTLTVLQAGMVKLHPHCSGTKLQENVMEAFAPKGHFPN